MKLTALEIKQQTFDKSLRGYDVSEVNAYLSIVANEWENLVTRNKDLEREVEQMRDKLQHYQRVEEALHETLQTAKDSAEQRLSGARKEASDKIEKAEMEAESLIREARQQRQQIRQSILRLLDRREEIIGGIRSYLELAQESLGQFTRDEATLFSLPEEEDRESVSDFERKLKMRMKTGETERARSESNAEERPAGAKPSSGGDSLAAPGAEDLDDIIDELD